MKKIHGNAGRKHSKETIEKLRASHLGYNGRIGYVMPESVKQKIRNKLKGKVGNRKGQHCSVETRRKMSISGIKRMESVYNVRETVIEKKMESLLVNLGFVRDVHFFRNKNMGNRCNVDFYIPMFNLVIECDGCFWHGCPIHYPQNTRAYESTISKTIKLKEGGYIVSRFWEHEINTMVIK